jgi:hypothetical protein
VTVFNPRPLCFDWNLWRGRGRSEKTAGKGEEEGGSPPEEMQVHQKELTGNRTGGGVHPGISPGGGDRDPDWRRRTYSLMLSGGRDRDPGRRRRKLPEDVSRKE